MSVKADVNGADIVISRLQAMQSGLDKRLKEAMNLSVRDVQERARATHRFKTRTGKAERSIEAKVTGAGGNIEGTVGTTRLITVYLHQGTRPHNIVPRRKKVLRWASGGNFVFARRVYHPGTQKDEFIYNAADAEKEAIISRFDAIFDKMG